MTSTKEYLNIQAQIMATAATADGYRREDERCKRFLGLAVADGRLFAHRTKFMRYFTTERARDAYDQRSRAAVAKLRADYSEKLKLNRPSRAKPAKVKPVKPVKTEKAAKKSPAPVKAWNLPVPAKSAAPQKAKSKADADADYSRAKYWPVAPAIYTPLNPARDCSMAPTSRAAVCKDSEMST